MKRISMHASPLRLDRYAFKRIELRAADDADQLAVNLIEAELTTFTHTSDENRFRIGLSVSLLPISQEETTPAYSGVLEIMGEFTVVDGFQGNPMVMALNNGAAILFGAVREMVLTVTSRGPWPPTMLPTTSFLSIAEEIAKPPSEEDTSEDQVEPHEANTGNS